MTVLKDKLEYKYLKIVPFNSWLNWDAKSYAVNNLKSDYEFVKLGMVLKEQTEKVKLKDFPDQEFGILGVNNKTGIFDAYLEKGSKINQPYKIMKTNWIAYNPYRVNVGSVGIKTVNEKYEYISNAYVVFSCIEEKLNTDFFFRLFKTDTFNKLVKKSTKGSVRQNLSYDLLSIIQIPLPPISTQKALVVSYDKELTEATKLENKVKGLNEKIESYLALELGITLDEKQKTKGLFFVNFKDLKKWTSTKAIYEKIEEKSRYKTSLIIKISEDISRGKSPKYDEKSENIILNQKCNRWNEIDLGFAKTVNADWYKKQKLLTREGDVLINSTGEGTIGRSSFISKEYAELLFDSHMLLFRGKQDLINGKYFVYWFNSKINQEYLNEIKSAQTTKQTELGSSNLGNMLIPLPSIDIQNKIVNKIENLEKEIENTKQKVELLKAEAKKKFEDNLFNI